ncbi:MAG: HlyD family secretion protein [Flavobacteriales bacterium]
MDIAISKKKSLPYQHLIVIAIAVLALLVLGRYMWRLSSAEFKVDRDSIMVSEVQRGEFKVSIRGTGVLVPDNVQWLSADVDATVERLVVKAGNVVNTGDLLVVMRNPQLEQKLSESQWELEAMKAEIKASRVAQESALLEQKTALLNAKLAYESSALRYEAQSVLIGTGAVSKLEYQRTGLETDQLKQRWSISIEQYSKMQENLVAQNEARVARIKQIKNRVERIEQQVAGLHVRASMPSVVLEAPLEPGQRISTGTKIAKLAQQNLLIAELQVAELLIGDVALGQTVVVDTRNSTIRGEVIRIDPAVINGNVQIDIRFTEDLPADARPDLSVDGEILVAEIDDAIFVDRPLFSQSHSETKIYKISRDGVFAEQVSVSLGSGSVNKIQIMNGLQVGDRIVVSDPSKFESYKSFLIN